MGLGGRGRERREEKGKHSPPFPPKEIDPQLFLDAYSSHTFLYKSQDMGSVQKLHSKRQLLTQEDEAGGTCRHLGSQEKEGEWEGLQGHLPTNSQQNTSEFGRQSVEAIEEKLFHHNLQVQVPTSVFLLLYVAWGRSLGKSNETLGSEPRQMQFGASHLTVLCLSFPIYKTMLVTVRHREDSLVHLVLSNS